MSVKELKMWLAVREDLNMSLGKLAVQSGHAFMLLATECIRLQHPNYYPYLNSSMLKVVVKVKSEEELLKVQSIASEHNILNSLVEDEGRTEFDGATKTVVAFGPCLKEDLPKYLQRLRLLQKKEQEHGIH